MCRFVTAVLPRAANAGLADEIARRHHRQMAPLASSRISRWLYQDEACFSTTPDSAMCDCDTALGWHARALARRPGPQDLDSGSTGAPCRSWSDAGFERWLELKQGSEADAADPESSPLLDDWFALLSELLRSGATPYVGLLLHGDSGEPGEPIQLKGRNESRLSQRGRTTLASMDEDQLYVFRD